MIHLWYNGVIYAGNGQFIEAFAIRDNLILATGTQSEVTSFCEQQQEEILPHDLNGRFVCAGFNDSHMHLLSLGKSLLEVNLAEHTDSREAMIAYLKSCPRQTQWLCGRGWNQESFQGDKSLPTRYDLDQVSTEIPIYLARACGHIAVVNSKTLSLMGLDASTKQTPDASFDLDEHGEPTGILRENALNWVRPLIPSPSREEIKSMLEAAGRLANSYGITSVQTDDFEMWDGISFEETLSCYQELQAEGRLHLRINEQCLLPDMGKLRDFLDRGYRTGKPPLEQSGPLPANDPCAGNCDRLRIGPLKLMLDGSLGAGTAYLQEDYADAPGQRGMPLYTQAELNDLISTAHAAGMQIAMHAIGDGAVQMAMDALRQAQTICPRKDTRHGIVHCQLTTADQLRAFQELELHAYIQSIFLDADAPVVEKRVSHELASTSYQAASYLQNGVSLSNGSDAPIELPHVMAGIQCAVTRQPLPEKTARQSGTDSGIKDLPQPCCPPYLPDQALTVAQAIDSFTCMGAYASFEENKKGRIAPGMLADFVILGRNPFETPAGQLADIPVLAVIFDGKEIPTSTEE